MQREIRVEFIGRKKTNRDENFNYRITQKVYADNMDEAETALEEKYVVVEILND